MNTIKSKKSIKKIFFNGKYIRFNFITLIIYKDLNLEINGNVGFIAGKKYGNAVWRNKNKRRLREIARQITIPDNTKILFIANKKTLNTKFREIVDRCRKVMEKL